MRDEGDNAVAAAPQDLVVGGKLASHSQPRHKILAAGRTCETKRKRKINAPHNRPYSSSRIHRRKKVPANLIVQEVVGGHLYLSG